MSDLFNAQGELNAYDTGDALQQLVKYASVLADGHKALNAPESSVPTYTDEQREQLLQSALMTQQGKIALGQAMANPIRRRLDYQGVGRKALKVDPLPQGALPVYDKDITVEAVVVSSNGSAPESRIQGDRVTVPEFEIVANPTVRIAEVKRRRFNVIDRAQQKARQMIQAQEDANIFQALDVASTIENTATTLTGELNKIELLTMKEEIDRWDLVTSKYFMHIRQFTNILNWESAGGTNSQVDPVTQREVLQTGLFGHIWGADIIVSRVVPVGTVYACADPEFVGVMPIRQDIEVIPADEPKLLKLGWVVSEIVGVGILNPRGVAVARAS